MDEYIKREAVKEAIGFTRLNCVAYGENKSLSDVINEIPAVDVVPLALLELLEKWLYEIAFNNLGTGSQKDTAFAESCKEIINRLDGLRAFIRDETNN